MRRMLFALMGALVMAIPARGQDRAYFHASVCSSGAEGAWFIVNVGDTCGCLVKLYGVDCGSNRFAHYFRLEPRHADPGEGYDYYFSGTSPSGQSWYVKIDLDRDGRFARAWGMTVDGGYYEAYVDALPTGE